MERITHDSTQKMFDHLCRVMDIDIHYTQGYHPRAIVIISGQTVFETGSQQTLNTFISGIYIGMQISGEINV